PGLIALVMVCLAMLPNRVANQVPSLFGHTVALLSFIAMLASLAAGWVTTGRDTPLTAVFSPRLTSPIGMGVYLDLVAVVMAVLISFIGLIIARFSIRYLAGDANQGRFFRWMSLTFGSSLLMAVASNLLVFGIAWMLTSLGLHQLLTHYPDRPWAIWAARKKFLISRLGDLLLVGAIWLTFTHLGTLDYTDIFSWVEKSRDSGAETDPVLAWIAFLFVLGAMTKSAQVPFHIWLPDTMETPTPVSALMHAGVINAGGFLVIRLSPLVALTPLALDLLAVVGAVTALMGGVVMLTQTSIKRSLAYSTIAQMGFMMLQCGLGAFSAGLLHIVAHSAYKAHAFLRSGSVLEKSPCSLEPWRPFTPWCLPFGPLPIMSLSTHFSDLPTNLS
ncbi:MAG: NADH-quinone oxidoreductase subunit L, partial [Gemmataceae bacterium]